MNLKYEEKRGKRWQTSSNMQQYLSLLKQTRINPATLNCEDKTHFVSSPEYTNTLLLTSPELEEHAALLLPLCDHLEGIQAAVAPMAVPTAECDERAVEAIVPGTVFIHIPQTVLIPTDCKTGQRAMTSMIRVKTRWKETVGAQLLHYSINGHFPPTSFYVLPHTVLTVPLHIIIYLITRQF